MITTEDQPEDQPEDQREDQLGIYVISSKALFYFFKG